MSRAHRQEPTGPAPSGLSRSAASQAEPLVPCAALLDLAERCEAATAADRGLDGEIAKALMPHREWHRFEDTWGCRCIHDGSAFDMPDEYTASTDAAMTLVPDAAELAIYTHWPLTRGQPENEDGSRTITPNTPRGVWARTFGGKRLHRNCRGEAHTLALALCAIGLRMRAASAQSERTAA